MVPPTTLEITGYHSDSLENVFFQRAASSGRALVLPGMGYGPEYAGLSYPIALLTELGFDVLALKSRYASPEFKAVADAEAVQWLREDALGAFKAGGMAAEQRFCLMGKSIGTVGMAALLEVQPLPQKSQLIWLTPLLQRELVRQNLRQFAAQSLVVIGTADPAYDAGTLAELQGEGAQVIVLDRVHHNFMVEDEALESVQRLVEVLRGIKTFLTR